MKRVIAVLDANLEETPLGTRSRLADSLLGQPVLRRTVARVRRAKHVEQVFVLCPPHQAEQGRSLLSDLDAVVAPHDGGPSPWRALVQTARKWSLDGWRGGLGGTTCFDEFTDCRLIAGLLDSVPADAVLSVPASGPVFDPALADRMIEHWSADEYDSRLTFVQAPPGLAGVLLDARLVRELIEKNTPVGWLFSYQPDHPRKDLIFESSCCPTAVEVRHAGGRLMADTRRAFETLTSLLSDHPDADAVTIGQWLTNRENRHVPPLPREVEIELTTDDPYPHTLARPRGDRVPRRGPIDFAIVERIAEEMSAYDDALIVLGGFGDPLRHPQFATVLDRLRPASSARSGVCGLAIRTPAVDLMGSADDRGRNEMIDALISHRVDVLNVTLDAWTPELYARLHSPDDASIADLALVLDRLDRMAERRQERGSVYPILVPELTKMRENVHELDDFHDGWLRRNGAASIGGYSHHARQLEDRSVMSMAPPGRMVCRRLQSRCLVLADGHVTLCDQDFQGRLVVGCLAPSPAEPFSPHGDRVPIHGSLEEIWQSAAFERVRCAHRSGRFDVNPLCAACDEWHRP